MADYSDEEVAPTPAEIKRVTKALQDAVKQFYADHEDKDNLTVRNIRTRAEVVLGLEADTLKSQPFWREKSKQLIQEAVEKQEQSAGTQEQKPKAKPKPKPKPKSPPLKQKKAPVTKATPKAKPKKIEPEEDDEEEEEEEAPRPRNRGATKKQAKAKPASDEEMSDLSSLETQETPEPQPARRKLGKRVKPTVQSDEEMSEPEEEAPTKRRRLKHKAVQDESEMSIDRSDDETSAPPSSTQKAKSRAEEGNTAPARNAAEILSDSEMSEVIDEPVAKKRSRGAKKEKASAKSPRKPKASSTPRNSKENEPMDPEKEKIKELQGWLVKCGVRKVWGKELMKFSTNKEKINHLKGMLAEVGMTGRYSVEKARQIKNKRELASELEGIQQGAQIWGTTGGGEAVRTRSSRLAARPVAAAAKAQQFSDDSEEEPESEPESESDPESEAIVSNAGSASGSEGSLSEPGSDSE